jgi:hypothetical protein
MLQQGRNLVGFYRSIAGAFRGLDARIPREMDDKGAIELAVIENRDREDLDVIEEAGGYRAMVDLGWSVAEIASRSGRSEALIYAKLDLLGLDAATQEALRDKEISMQTARCLGRIEDEAQRVKALERVVKPTYQDMPLSEKQALPMIQRGFLEPQKRQKAWEKRCKALRKAHGAEIEIVSVADAGKFRHSYEYVACENEVPEHELAASAREDETFEAPTWGALAEKHGARKYAVPDEDGEAEFYVEREPIITAELVAGEKAPEGCIFPMHGDGRHAQALSREKTFAEHEVERKERRADVERRQKALVERIYAACVGGERLSIAEQEAAMTRLSRALAKHELLDTLNEVPLALGIDLETLGEGDENAGFGLWLDRVLAGGEPVADIFAMLLLGSEVLRLWVPGTDAPQVMQEMEEAWGGDRCFGVSEGGDLMSEEDGDDQAWKRLEDEHGATIIAAALRALKGTGSIVMQVEAKAIQKAQGLDGLRALRSYLRSDETDESRDGYDPKRGKRAVKFYEMLTAQIAAGGA